jgi:hypothetical protein
MVQLSMFDVADKAPATQNWGHPFYWAAFALIGDGKRVAAANAENAPGTLLAAR